MKRSVAIIATVAVLVLAIPEVRAETPVAAPPADAAQPPDPALKADEATQASVAKDKRLDHLCLRETGSRVRASDRSRRGCTELGRVYTRDDIASTGEVDIADALRRLDPSIH